MSADLLTPAFVVPDMPVGTMASDGVREVFVHAGQLFVSADPARVTTVLGSCVAVCMWDPFGCIGGVNHYMFPAAVGGKSGTPRFASTAIAALIAELLRLGAVRHRLRAKLFGGACTLTAFQAGREVGLQNVEAGKQRLAAERIPVLAEDTGGNHGRKVVFRTDTGAVLMRMVC